MPNNIWKKDDFTKGGLVSRMKHIRRCIRWSRQRIMRGYAECDMWNMDLYLQRLIPEMLQELRDKRNGSPSYLGEEYVNEEGILVNDTCHEEWDEILDRMIFLWREADEDTYTVMNPYEKEFDKASTEFSARYGFIGEKLRTEEECAADKRHGWITSHSMWELPEYKEISDRYFEKKRELAEYRARCKDEAIDLLKEHFYALWD